MTNYFASFIFTNKEKLNRYIKSINSQIDYIELKDLLSTENINFTLNGISRLQGILLCEEGYSYVQQSHRYVPVNEKFINILSDTPDDIKSDGRRLISKSINLYTKMTELKDPDKTGRPDRDDFVYGIPYEEARCILPLAVSSNMVVSMSGDRLIDMLRLFNKYNIIFKDLRNEISTFIPSELYTVMNKASFHFAESDSNISDKYFREKTKELSLDDNVILLDSFNRVAVAALASQNSETPNSIYNSWGEETKIKSNKLIKNVLGYNHSGINEHARTTFAMECSIITYNQVIRHRLQNIRRESFTDIINDTSREYLIPDSVKNNPEFLEEVNNLIDEYKDFYNRYRRSCSNQYIMQFLLNSTGVKFIVSSNVRNDNIIFRDRLCYTAQEEIRNMYLKKYRILYILYPNLVKYGLPPCVTSNKCKEGKLSCGRIEEVLEQYSEFL